MPAGAGAGELGGDGGADLVLGAFASAQGPGADAEYSPRAWLIHKTGVTRGAAMAYTAWVRRAEDHPRVFAALAAEAAVRVGGQGRVPVDEPAAGRLPGCRG